MAKDPRSFVRPGEKLTIAASQINALNAMMRKSAGYQSGELPAYAPGQNVILARNSTGGDLARWGIMEITGIEIDPSSGDTQRRSFEEMPCIVGSTPSKNSGFRIAIAIEPIKSGKMGRVSVAGVVQCKVAGSDSTLKRARPKASTSELEAAKTGPFEILWREGGGSGGDGWALVRFDDDGSDDRVRLGKTTSTWTKGTLAEIELYEEGTPPSETRNASDYTLEDCVNKFATVAAEKWVMVAKARNDSWYLIAAEC